MDKKGKIESSIGSVNFRRQKENRVLTVEDASEAPQVIERSFGSSGRHMDYEVDQDAEIERIKELEAIKKRKYESEHRASDGARKTIEYLLGMTRLADDVVIDGVTFSIRTLKAKETEEVITEIALIDNAAIQALEIRAQTIARALWAIDGHEINMILGSSRLEDRVAFVKELDESFLNHLFTKYSDLIKENSKRFSVELGGSDKEIADTVKKS